MKTETANDGLVSRTKHLFLGIERGDELSELTNRKNVGYTYKDSRPNSVRTDEKVTN